MTVLQSVAAAWYHEIPNLVLKPGRGLLEPSFATARDRTFREKDGLEYISKAGNGQTDEFCSKNRTKI
jgi:hypothetical protein